MLETEFSMVFHYPDIDLCLCVIMCERLMERRATYVCLHGILSVCVWAYILQWVFEKWLMELDGGRVAMINQLECAEELV